MKTNVGFTQIGLTAALILNKLRVRAQLTSEEQNGEKDERRSEHHQNDGAKEHPDERGNEVDQRLRHRAAMLKG